MEHGGGIPGAALRIDGDLRLRQTWPISVYGGKNYPPKVWCSGTPFSGESRIREV